MKNLIILVLLFISIIEGGLFVMTYNAFKKMEQNAYEVLDMAKEANNVATKWKNEYLSTSKLHTKCVLQNAELRGL